MKFIVVTDSLVDTLYGNLVTQILDASKILIPRGEKGKSAKALRHILQSLHKLDCDRATTLVALGGGALLDVAGFAASIYLRGIPWIALPTTPIAMIDASIGGKVAINTSWGKNQLGSFHPPITTIIDWNLISEKQRNSAASEVIKMALVYKGSLDDVTSNEALFIALKAKQEIVRKDPQEKGLRCILNFGHTVGHALETISHYRISHAQAVALGCLAESHLSMRLAGLPDQEFKQIAIALHPYTCPLPPNYSREELLRAMQSDKKRENSHIRSVLINRIGHVVAYEGDYCRPITFKEWNFSLEWLEQHYG